jgi:hypothetical protein
VWNSPGKRSQTQDLKYYEEPGETITTELASNSNFMYQYLDLMAIPFHVDVEISGFDSSLVVFTMF